MRLPGLVLLLAATAAASAAEPPSTRTNKPPPRFATKPLPQDFYPSVSEALKEEGTVELLLCHDEFGIVIAQRIQKSSGFERLDQAAWRIARSYHFKPVVIDGRRQPDCAVVPVTFSLTPPAGPPDRGEGGALWRTSPAPKRIPLHGEQRIAAASRGT